jgi:hypothetical protein
MCALERLHLHRVALSPMFKSYQSQFEQLQVLVLAECSVSTGALQAGPARGLQKRLLRALGSCRRLRKLALHLTDEWVLSADDLLRSLPPSLTAADLSVLGTTEDSGSADSGSIAHLVHLTSLRLRGLEIMVWGHGQQEEEEEEGTVAGAGGLTALSMRPFQLRGVVHTPYASGGGAVLWP